MPRVGTEPTISAFEWAKTVHALDRAAIVIGLSMDYMTLYLRRWNSLWSKLYLYFNSNSAYSNIEWYDDSE
jgi:hypothetical protein